MKQFFSLAAIAFMAGVLPAQEPEITREQGERITEITSNHMVANYQEKKAVFTGNVKVNNPDMTLTGEKLIVWLTEDDEIRLIEAEENVVIRMEGLSSQSGKAVYDPSTGELVLTERPQVSRQGSILQAVKFTYYQFEDRLKAESGGGGQVRLLNFEDGAESREP
jgi:lipopolysaccharide transport protein LptA